MNTTEAQLKLFAAAIYEIRELLAPDAGPKAEPSVRLAWHLAYALHNDALEVLDGDGNFDVAATRSRIARAEELIGARFGNGHGQLV